MLVGSSRRPRHREGLSTGTSKKGGMVLLPGRRPDPHPVPPKGTQETCPDPNQSCRQEPAGAGCRKGRSRARRELPGSCSPLTLCCTLTAFRFYIKKRHKARSLLAFS